LPLWIRPFLTTSEESQLGQVRGDIQDPTKHLFLYPYISRTTQSPTCKIDVNVITKIGILKWSRNEHFPSVSREKAIAALELVKEMLTAYANPA
jgi:hypothetical protein